MLSSDWIFTYSTSNIDDPLRILVIGYLTIERETEIGDEKTMSEGKLKKLSKQKFEKMSRLRFLVRCRSTLTPEELDDVSKLTVEVFSFNPMWYNVNEFTRDEAKNFLDLVERCIQSGKLTNMFSL